MPRRALARFFDTVINRHPRAWQWLLWMVAIAVCYLALTPHPPKKMSLGWDKLNHTTAFATLMVCACLGFARRRSVPWLATALSLLAFGGLIELVQAFIPGREADTFDLLADALGMAIGGLIVLATRKLSGSTR